MNQVYIPLSSLKNICLRIVVDTFEEKFLNFYCSKWDKICDENTPDFGPVKDLTPPVLTLIIEELIRREELGYKHLKVLLPRETRSLTCDENSKFSPFQLSTIELISKRCPNFEILHYHKPMTDQDKVLMLDLNNVLRDSILQLNSLKEINLHDSKIESTTIRIITKTCTKLTELNLHKTNLSDEGLNYIHDEESVIKDSLTTLIIDETNVSAQSAGQCLFNLRNLAHFQFDRTIESCVSIFKNTENFKDLSLVPEFKTTLFKGTLDISDDEKLQLMDQEFQTRLTKMFPEVRHLILMSITDDLIPFVGKLVRSLKHIKHLELSAPNLGLHKDKDFSKLIPMLKECSKKLITLKLENFCSVPFFFLEKNLENLEKLTLIRNCITQCCVPFQQENLKEYEMAYLSKNYRCITYLNKVKPLLSKSNAISHTVKNSPNLEKITIHGKKNFSSKSLKYLLKNGYLRNLKELKVFSCPIQMDCIMELFNKRIPIETIVVGSCDSISDQDANQISAFIKKNNYATTFYITKKDPYC